MKRRILLLLVVLMVIPTIAFGGMTIVKKKGGAAASGYYDPDADISVGGEWASDCTTFYPCLDDAVRYNNAPDNDPTNYCIAPFDATTLELGFPEITGTISTLRVWIYGNDAEAEAAGIIQVNISQDGSTWQTAQNFNLPDNWGSVAWTYVDFTSLSWTNTTDLRLRITRTGEGEFRNIYFWAVYIEANPS